MSDTILEKNEFDYKDDEIAFIKGTTKHKKIIPLRLMPNVIFPFQVLREIISEPELIRILKQAHDESTVIGLLYHAETEEGLPPLGRVGTSAIVPEIAETVNGSYLVKIVPINRFFTDEYVESDGIIPMARVNYYGDRPEPEEEIKPHRERLIELLTNMGHLLNDKSLQNVAYESDPDLVIFYSYVFVSRHPHMTEEMKLILLWMYKLSQRLEFVNVLMSDSLVSAERVAKRISDAENN